MNILHLQPKLNLTCGISKTIYLITKYLRDDCEQIVFSLGGDAIPKFRAAGINIILSKCLHNNSIHSILLLIELIRIIKKYKIDIIHSHHRYFDFLAFLISRFVSVRTVTSVQSKVFDRKIFSYKAENFIACGYNIKKHLEENFQIDPVKIKVIHNFIDPTELNINIDKSTLKRELNIDENLIVLGFVGRFSVKEKGIDVLLESFRMLSSENFQIILLLAGDGEDKEFITEFAQKNKLNIRVVLSLENVFNYYNLMDIIILPSRVDPFPLVMLESGLMKKAFIGSKVDGIKEFIENGKNGILVESGNFNSLAIGLKTLIENPQLRLTLGEELCTKVMNNFTSDKIIPLYEQTYLEALGRYK